MQRTIRLEADQYRITGDGVVERFISEPTGHLPDYDAKNWTAEMDKCERWVWEATKYRVGEPAVLVSCTDLSPNAIREGRDVPTYWLSFDLDGVPGNSNPKIKRTDGWRGTTDDQSVSAHGVVTIRAIRVLRNGAVAVTVK